MATHLFIISILLPFLLPYLLQFDNATMKRQTPPTEHNSREKKQRIQRPIVRETETVYDQAESYLLTTVKFPIDALTAEWDIGVNRPINEAHKRRLCEIFRSIGVLRKDPNHRLQIVCTKAQVQKMLAHIDRVQAKVEKDEWPSFEDWGHVIGEPAELMAGNHRVEALKENLRRAGAGEKERWWICNVYDKGLTFTPARISQDKLTCKQIRYHHTCGPSFGLTEKMWSYLTATGKYGLS